MEGILHRSGFLGTSGNFAADMTLVIMLLVSITFTAGMVLAKRGKYLAHQWMQTAGGVLALIMVLWMMILPFRDFVIQDVGGPRPGIFYVITGIHAVLGVAATVFGLFVILRGNGLMIKSLKFNNYKPFMRAAYALYVGAIVFGILVYVTWFVIIPSPPVFQ